MNQVNINNLKVVKKLYPIHRPSWVVILNLNQNYDFQTTILDEL